MKKYFKRLKNAFNDSTSFGKIYQDLILIGIFKIFHSTIPIS